MKKLFKLFCLLFFFVYGNVNTANSQTTNFTITTVPNAQPDFTYRPGRGMYDWYFQQSINIPTQAAPTNAADLYYRFTWVNFQNCSVTNPSSYDFTFFDQQINQAIGFGMHFAFGIMHECGGCDFSNFKCNAGGADMSYPIYLHNLMQADPIKDWVATGTNASGDWVPYYNGNTWLTAWENLNIAVNNHIMTTSFNGVRYQDVVSYVDARGYADFGEWAIYENEGGSTAQMDITAATAKRILDATYNAYPNFKILNLLGTFSASNNNSYTASVAPEVGAYALQARGGTTGIRFDSWGIEDGNTHIYFGSPGWFTNTTVYNGYHYDTAIANRWKRAIIGGEPVNADIGFNSLVPQMTAWHSNGIGNGNIPGSAISNTTVQNNFRAASFASGYRYLLTGGNMTTTLTSGGNFNLTPTWQNVGLTPTYENWNVTYILSTSVGGPVFWTGTSALNLRTLLPSSPVVVGETFTLGSVPAGSYNLYMVVKDPTGFRQPMPLAITGRNTDGSYTLRTGITVIAPVNPTANAGPDQTIVLPTSTATLNGSASTGTITSYLWTKITGPAGGAITSPTSVTTTITGLLQGTYVYQLSLNGGVSLDQVVITVNPSAPTANAGPGQTITLPTFSVNVSGSGSTGTITSYLWTQLSGPASPTITTPTAINTSITGFSVAGTYVFQLSLNGGVSADQMTVVVNPAIPTPVANAGPNQSITLPTAQATLNGSGSTGTITSYLWTQVSGPNTSTIVSPSAVSTSVTGLVQGVYTFRLSLNGGVSTSTTQVTVNPIPPPIANAGANQTITLPTSTATLNSSASTGTITGRLWSQLSGPITATIVTPTGVSTSVTGLTTAGVYVFQISLNGGTATSTTSVTVNPAPPPGVNVFTTQIPANTTFNDAAPIELGMKFRSTQNGYITGVRFYKTTGNTGTHTGELYSYPGGVRLAQKVFSSETASGWQSVTFTTPVPITANVTYVVAYFSASGNYAATTGYFSTAVSNPPLVGLADGTDGHNGIYQYSATPVFPTQYTTVPAPNDKPNYWVDIIYSPTNGQTGHGKKRGGNVIGINVP